MERKDGTKVTKTTVKVWRPLADKLEARMTEACLRRDFYLARLLTSEVQHLDAEVAVASSQAAYEHVSDRLERLDRKAVSLALPPALVGQINEVCKSKRIVRDAFFNRLFLLLAASPKNLNALLFPTYEGDWKQDVWHEYGNDSATVDLGVLPLASVTEPFWAIREAFVMNNRNLNSQESPDQGSGTTVQMIKVQPGKWTLPENVYTKYMDQKAGQHDLIGLNCYLPDWRLPTCEVKSRSVNTLDSLLG